MTEKKKESSAIKQISIAVVVAIAAGSSSPWWWNEIFNKNKTKEKPETIIEENVETIDPKTCKEGYVWREASPDDFVCVTPDIRAQVQSDNQQADERIKPEGGAYGVNTCKEGYVWREAFPNDFVCVKPEVRAQAQVDNRYENTRIK